MALAEPGQASSGSTAPPAATHVTERSWKPSPQGTLQSPHSPKTSVPLVLLWPVAGGAEGEGGLRGLKDIRGGGGEGGGGDGGGLQENGSGQSMAGRELREGAHSQEKGVSKEQSQARSCLVGAHVLTLVGEAAEAGERSQIQQPL